MKYKLIDAAVERLMNSPKRKTADSDKAWIGCDLDGTLAKYDGWKGWDHIGDPIPNMVKRIKEYISKGIKVKIWTARASQVSRSRSNITFQQMEKVIQDWTEKHLGIRLEVVTEKDCYMMAAIDDSIMQVEPNTGNIIGSEILIDVDTDADYEHPIKDYIFSDIDGVLEWNSVDIDGCCIEDFNSGLLKGGFTRVSNLDCPGTQYAIQAENETNVVRFYINTRSGHLKHEKDTVWCVIDVAVAAGSNRLAFKMDNLSFRSLGKWMADRTITKPN